MVFQFHDGAFPMVSLFFTGKKPWGFPDVELRGWTTGTPRGWASLVWDRALDPVPGLGLSQIWWVILCRLSQGLNNSLKKQKQVYTYVYIYVYIHMHTCVYIWYIYIYIHMYAYAYANHIINNHNETKPKTKLWCASVRETHHRGVQSLGLGDPDPRNVKLSKTDTQKKICIRVYIYIFTVI